MRRTHRFWTVFFSATKSTSIWVGEWISRTAGIRSVNDLMGVSKNLRVPKNKYSMLWYALGKNGIFGYNSLKMLFFQHEWRLIHCNSLELFHSSIEEEKVLGVLTWRYFNKNGSSLLFINCIMQYLRQHIPEDRLLSRKTVILWLHYSSILSPPGYILWKCFKDEMFEYNLSTSGKLKENIKREMRI